MQPTRRAVIDVGTNSVKLLVADVNGSEVLPVWEGSKQTRLGQSFYKTHNLQPAAIQKTAEAAGEFQRQAISLGATSVRVIATSAAREATNATELLSAIFDVSGLTAQIISGNQEADWAFRGITTDPTLRGIPLLLLDVGGGSTEFILGQDEERHFCGSFPLGTVRLLEHLPHSDPPTGVELASYRQWVSEFLENEAKLELQPALEREMARTALGARIQLVGTGGTAGILGSMELELRSFDRQSLERATLSQQRVQWHIARLWGLPLSERKQVIGLPPNRADVILAGAVIYEGIMQKLGFQELRISTRGLRFAALMELTQTSAAG